MSHQFLWRAVGVYEQLALLPESRRMKLSVSHHHALLSVPDPEVKVKLFEAALDEGLDAQQLKKRVARYRRKRLGPSKAGRPPLAAVVKGVRRLKNASEVAFEEEITPAALKRLSNRGLATLIQELDDGLGEFARVRAQLRRVLDRRQNG